MTATVRWKMLRSKHLRIALLPYFAYSAVSFLPFIVDLRTCKIQEQRSGWHRILQKVLFIWMNIRGCLYFYKAAEVALTPNDVLKFLPLAVVAGFSTIIVSVTIYLAFIKYPEVTVSIFNSLIQGEDERRNKWWKMSMVEYFILTTPWNIPVFGLMPVVLALIAPRAPYTLFAFLPPSCPTYLILVFVKTAEDFRGLLKTVNTLTVIGYSPRRVYRLLKQLRGIQMLILMYNQAYRYVHFACKINCIFCSILCTSSGILLIRSSTHQAIAYFMSASQAVLIYCILFHKTFSIPMLMAKLRKEIGHVVKMNATYVDEKAFLLKSTRALPSIAIKVGHFHGFERMSTPNFLGFVVKNITRILIAARNRN